jgi:hypothetical protein
MDKGYRQSFDGCHVRLSDKLDGGAMEKPDIVTAAEYPNIF